jgi:hypothetical protein
MEFFRNLLGRNQDILGSSGQHISEYRPIKKPIWAYEEMGLGKVGYT